MSHVQVFPAFTAIEKQLRALDRQRDQLRAQMADAALAADLAHVDREFWTTTEQRTAKKAALEEKIAKRAARRATEMATFGSYTRPGAWDDDLDNFQEPQYEETVGEYTIRLVRARDLTYNGYVVLPEGHDAIDKSYDEVNEARPPVYLSHASGNTFGFYFERTVKPRDNFDNYDQHNFYSGEETGYIPTIGSNYYDYAKMRECCLKLIDFFTSWNFPALKEWFCPACGAQGSPERKLCDFCDARSIEEEHGDYPWHPEYRGRADSRESFIEDSLGPAPVVRRRVDYCAAIGLCICDGSCKDAAPAAPAPAALTPQQQVQAITAARAAQAFLESYDSQLLGLPKPAAKKSWAQVVRNK